MDWETLGLIVFLVSTLAMMARALSRAAEANKSASENTIALSKTVIDLNNEVQEQSKERQAWAIERASWAKSRDDLNTRIDDLTAETTRLNGLVTAEREARKAKERESEQSIKKLTDRIAELEKERAALRAKVDELVGMLIQAEKDKAARDEIIDGLEADLKRTATQLASVEARLNGKADKPDTGPLAESIAHATDAAKPADVEG